MADTRDTIRDGVRDTGNALGRAVPSQDNTGMIVLIVGAVAALLVTLYALGFLGGTTMTTQTTTEGMTPSTVESTPAPAIRPAN